MVPAPPLFDSLTGWAGGAAPPCVAEKLSDVGDTASAGGAGGLSVSVTGTVLGAPVEPGESIVTFPVYVPALRPDVSTETVTSLGAVPLPGDAESHGLSSEAAKLSVPPPVLDTVKVFDAGFDPPATPLNDSEDGLTESAGGAGGPELTAYAESGPSVKFPPVAHVAGRSVSVRPALVCSGPPLAPPAWSR